MGLNKYLSNRFEDTSVELWHRLIKVCLTWQLIFCTIFPAALTVMEEVLIFQKWLELDYYVGSLFTWLHYFVGAALWEMK